MTLRSPLYHFYDFFESISWVLVKLLFRDELNCYTKGKCRFYGNDNFVHISEKSLKIIEELDPELFFKLISHKITFIQPLHEYTFWRRINRRFVINDWMIKKDTEGMIYGVIVYLFHSLALESLGFIRKRFVIIENQNSLGLKDAKIWLEKHRINASFINGLDQVIDCCDEQNICRKDSP